MKIVIFDFDGTLTKSKKGTSSWRKVWEAIDDLDYDNFLFNKFKNGEIDDDAWLELILDRYKQKGVNNQILENISSKVELQDGAVEMLKKLYDKKIKIFILSGGVKNIIEYVLKREKIYNIITSVEAYDFIFDKNKILQSFKKPEHNLEDKSEYVNLLKKEYGVSGEDILFVGNGINDETVYKSGAVTLCINPDGANSNDKQIWNYCIDNCTNLKQILKFVK